MLFKKKLQISQLFYAENYVVHKAYTKNSSGIFRKIQEFKHIIYAVHQKCGLVPSAKSRTQNCKKQEHGLKVRWGMVPYVREADG